MASRFLQGRFKPTNPSKYKGDINSIFFRSSWELAFLKWLDKNDAVLDYSSEEIIIPYISPVDNRTHRYFPDFRFTTRTANGGRKTYMVEIKPYRQTLQPKPPKRKTKNYLTEVSTYLVNKEKWKNAEIYAQNRNMEFKVITEKDLFGIK